MGTLDEKVTAQYVYRSEVPSERHRRLTSWYLVARLEGSNVVARIDALGLFPSSRTLGASSSPAPGDLVRTIGPWAATASGHHAKVMVALADSSARPAARSRGK